MLISFTENGYYLYGGGLVSGKIVVQKSLNLCNPRFDPLSRQVNFLPPPPLIANNSGQSLISLMLFW